MIRVLLLLIATGLHAVAAQSVTDKQSDISRVAEDLIAPPDEEESAESANEALLQLVSKPQDLNRSGH